MLEVDNKGGRRVEGIQGEGKQEKQQTDLWAFLEPLAFPPDLPPVILMDLFDGKGWVWLFELMWKT